MVTAVQVLPEYHVALPAFLDPTTTCLGILLPKLYQDTAASNLVGRSQKSILMNFT